MCPRRDAGRNVKGSEGPGPAYYPGYDNKGHMSSSGGFSFADIESRGRDKVVKRQLGTPDIMAPSLSMIERTKLNSIRKLSGGGGRMRRAKSSGVVGGGSGSRRRGSRQQQERRVAPTMNMTLEETKQLLADASIHEMRKGIWHKIRGRGDGKERQIKNDDSLFDSLDHHAAL
jgi:hypothetical protein